jgi:hypothetical protein
MTIGAMIYNDQVSLSISDTLVTNDAEYRSTMLLPLREEAEEIC